MNNLQSRVNNSRWPQLPVELHDEILERTDGVSDMVNWCRAFNDNPIFAEDVAAKVRQHNGWPKVERRVRAAAARPSQQQVIAANQRLFQGAEPRQLWRRGPLPAIPWGEVDWSLELMQHANKWVARVAWKKAYQAHGVLQANRVLSSESASLSSAAKSHFAAKRLTSLLSVAALYVAMGTVAGVTMGVYAHSLAIVVGLMSLPQLVAFSPRYLELCVFTFIAMDLGWAGLLLLHHGPSGAKRWFKTNFQEPASVVRNDAYHRYIDELAASMRLENLANQ